MSGGRTTYSLGEVLDYLDGIFPTMASNWISKVLRVIQAIIWDHKVPQDYLEAEDDEIDIRNVVIEDEAVNMKEFEVDCC